MWGGVATCIMSQPLIKDKTDKQLWPVRVQWRWGWGEGPVLGDGYVGTCVRALIKDKPLHGYYH